jgi:hypothetical protein
MTTIPRRPETDEERGERMRLEMELKRKSKAAEELAVDKMIRENIRLHGA